MSNYNPYRGSNGRFKSGPRKIQYANSDERDDAAEIEEDIELQARQFRQAENARKAKETEQRLQDLDREIANQSYKIHSHTLDTKTLQDNEKILKKLEEERDSLEYLLRIYKGGM